nr:DHA2 family efflux MFS transporter permease subunit [Rhizomicrobium palustre]
MEVAAIVLVLSMGNFLAVLDTTIANVLVPDIAGSLAVSSSNGTWVTTAYAVAEAIMVPLTGWLAGRFGPVKVFVAGIFGFGIFSLLCGLATSLGMLIAFRVALGICGGPLIPISQTLLLKIVPEKNRVAALAAWSMGTVLAPVAGPVLGGLISDHWGWQWAFHFKLPLAFLIGFVAWRVLSQHEQATEKAKVDYVGLGFLVLWVGALQIMLGNGQDQDWFNSSMIVELLIVTVIGFLAFVIWETTDKRPVVALNVFSNRIFSVTMMVTALAFGAMFGTIVLVPLWLQTAMGYTATWAGYNAALSGVTMVGFAPIATNLMTKIGPRAVACIGLLITAVSSTMRVSYNDQITFWQLMWPQLVFGAGMIMTMIPLMDMSTIALKEKDIASGAGQFNFIRTLSGAIATAAVVALWNNLIPSSHANLSAVLHNPQGFMDMAENAGMGTETARGVLNQIVNGQSVMQATNNTFLMLAGLNLLAAAAVWLAPKPPERTGEKPMMH